MTSCISVKVSCVDDDDSKFVDDDDSKLLLTMLCSVACSVLSMFMVLFFITFSACREFVDFSFRYLNVAFDCTVLLYRYRYSYQMSDSV